jgi:hypothetical protein
LIENILLQRILNRQPQDISYRGKTGAKKADVSTSREKSRSLFKRAKSNSDFPLLMTAEDPELFEQIYRSFYNVPESKVIANEERIKRFSQVSNRHESGLAVASVINDVKAENLFQESERFYGIKSHRALKDPDIKKHLKEIIAFSPGEDLMGKYKKARARALNETFISHSSHPITEKSSELVKELFPFERKKFKPRKKFLQTAVINYFEMLKNFQPYIYQLCLALAKGLHEQKPITSDIEGICCVSIHQDEPNVTRFLDALNQQNFNKRTCPIFLFVNGNSSEKIEKLTKAIAKYQQDSGSQLDIRVIEAKLDQWRYGLKSIPHITGLMTLALSGKLPDHDIASIFFDADILKFKSNDLINFHLKSIKKGHILTSGGYENDEQTLRAANINFYILDKLARLRHIIITGPPENFNEIMQDRQKAYYPRSGGNSSISTLLTVLSCGLAAHTHNEDTDQSLRATKNLIQAFGEQFEDFRQMDFAFLGDTSQEQLAAIYDGGATIRAAQTKRPLADLWDNHDLIEGNMPAIDETKPNEFNQKRFDEEIKSILLTKAGMLQDIFDDGNLSSKTKRELFLLFMNSLRRFVQEFNEVIREFNQETYNLEAREITNEENSYFFINMKLLTKVTFRLSVGYDL